MDNFKKLGFIALGLMAIGFILQNTIVKPDENLGAPPTTTPLETVATFDGDKFLGWIKPSDSDLATWAEDVKKESMNVKHDYQIDQLISMHQDKLDKKIAPILEKYLKYPDLLKAEAEQQLTREDYTPTKAEIDKLAEEKLKQAKWDVAKLRQSVKRAQMEKLIRFSKFIDRTQEILGTVYYIDCVNGNDASAGTATSSAWKTLDQFTENARAPGDKVIVRGGNLGLKYGSGSNCGTGTALTFTSDGIDENPIIIERDYGNNWRENSSSTQTYTVTYGSKTLTASANITDSKLLASGLGVGRTASSVIYVQGDDLRLFSYEVATAANTTVTLFLPYKGGQSGSGNVINIMPSNPVWSASTVGWTPGGDNFWSIQGITVTTGTSVILGDGYSWSLRDMVLMSGIDGAATQASIRGQSTPISGWNIYKHRTINNEQSLGSNSAGGVTTGIYFYDSLLDTGFAPTSRGAITMQGPGVVYVENTEVRNYDSVVEGSSAANGYSTVYLKNVSTTSSMANVADVGLKVLVEDYKGVIGQNKQFERNVRSGSSASAERTSSLESVTSTVRSGGGSTSILVTPTTSLSTVWENSRYKLFEYPIYSTAAARQVDVYMSVTATTNFTTDPTASELWIEADYWVTAGNDAVKKITKSTGVLDFNGSTAWQNLTINFTPAQAGIVYLRGYYAKTQESTKSNQFYVDVKPAIQ